MREYRGTVEVAARAMSQAEDRRRRGASKSTKNGNDGVQDGGEARTEEVMPAPAHGGGKGAEAGRDSGGNAESKLDVFAALRCVAPSVAGRLG